MLQITDPQIEAKLARADELPAAVVEATRVAYASRQRMVEHFVADLETLKRHIGVAVEYRLLITHQQERIAAITPENAQFWEQYMLDIEKTREHAAIAEQTLDGTMERFIKSYAAENRLEVRF